MTAIKSNNDQNRRPQEVLTRYGKSWMKSDARALLESVSGMYASAGDGLMEPRAWIIISISLAPADTQ